jgi:hypothetical protein
VTINGSGRYRISRKVLKHLLVRRKMLTSKTLKMSKKALNHPPPNCKAIKRKVLMHPMCRRKMLKP